MGRKSRGEMFISVSPFSGAGVQVYLVQKGKSCNHRHKFVVFSQFLIKGIIRIFVLKIFKGTTQEDVREI
jgi:hypothetical protein